MKINITIKQEKTSETYHLGEGSMESLLGVVSGLIIRSELETDTPTEEIRQGIDNVADYLTRIKIEGED